LKIFEGRIGILLKPRSPVKVFSPTQIGVGGGRRSGSAPGRHFSRWREAVHHRGPIRLTGKLLALVARGLAKSAGNDYKLIKGAKRLRRGEKTTSCMPRSCPLVKRVGKP